MFDEIEADRKTQSSWFGADHPDRHEAYILATKRLFGQLLAHRRPQTFVQFMRIVLEFTDQLAAATYYIDNDLELPPAFNACNDCVAGYFFHGCPKCRQPPSMPVSRVEVQWIDGDEPDIEPEHECCDDCGAQVRAECICEDERRYAELEPNNP